MRSRNPWLRAGLTIAAMLAVACTGAALRVVQAGGMFSSVAPGFAGSCKSVALPGVADIAIDAKEKTAFLAVLDARHPAPRDGIYAINLEGSVAPVRLAGTPKEFHPASLSLWRAPDGGLFLAAINRRSGSRASIDSFTVTRKDGAWVLAAQGTVMGGLLADPQDVAVVGPNSFYVSNAVTGRNVVMRWLQSHGVLPGGNIVYFNGALLREAANGLYGPRGLAATPDGSYLLVSNLMGRTLLSLNRESFTGNLSEAGNLDLRTGPDQLALDGQDNVWLAGHAKLSAWRGFASDPSARPPSQVFRVRLANGVPQSAEQVYGNDGGEIAGAETGAVLGKRLLIGSPLDGRLLDCGIGQ